jgi:hypothetical protein
MRCQTAVVKSGDELETRAFAAFLVDQLLRIIEAAAALRFASEALICSLRACGAGLRQFADFVLGNAVAETNDHARHVTIMRIIRKYLFHKAEACKQHVGDEVDQEMAEHVRDQVALPQIESCQNRA